MLKMLVNAALMTLGVGGLFPNVAQRRARDGARQVLRAQRRRRRVNEPNGRTVRSLMRAANRGWTPPQPTVKAMKRHAWYRRKLAAAALRNEAIPAV